MQLVMVNSKRIVNLEHMTQAKFFPAHIATEERFDETGNEHLVDIKKPEEVALYLTSVSGSEYEHSSAQEVIVSGPAALELWKYLETLCEAYRMGYAVGGTHEQIA